MKKLWTFRWVVGLGPALLLLAIIWPALLTPALADDGTPTPIPTRVTLDAKYPIITGESGDSFDWTIELSYTGAEKKRFNLSVTAPADWTATVTAGFASTQVAAVELGPSDSLPVTESLKVHVAPSFSKRPDPGEYTITLTASSGTLKASIDLTAKVTAKYGMSLKTETGRLNTEATAGKDTHLSLQLLNTGTAPMQNISFSSTKPEGWAITFNPDRIDSLPALYTQTIDVTINPPGGKTIAGDYAISLSAQGAKGSSSLDLRVTVLTPTIWGWVGIVIVLVVIAGLAVLFRILGRR